MLGYRQVGKAIDFDSIIRRFKSSYPIQIFFLRKVRVKGVMSTTIEELSKVAKSLKSQAIF